MQITLRQAASYLSVSETTIRRWVTTRGLPAHRVNERLHCNAIELWEWALEQGIPASRSLFDHARRGRTEVPPLSELVKAGGIHRDVEGEVKAAVLRAMVGVLPLPADVDCEYLVMVLEAREALGSTGIGEGIAIPHVRNPILLNVTEPFVTLCLLRHAVPFDALDGIPVHALFVVVSPTIPAHLRILAQLGHVLRDAQLRKHLRTLAPDGVILDRIAAVERGVSPGSGSAQRGT
ncbi:MAG: PTS sugar transporter subunit IIA [Gemmatimonadetes bacterium]|nr:PTS sugar transporter subunit IIA [Gemmatimonadota bacterium]